MLTSVRRGLLPVYDSMVFADTSESVDEVISPRFLFVSVFDRKIKHNYNQNYATL